LAPKANQELSNKSVDFRKPCFNLALFANENQKLSISTNRGILVNLQNLSPDDHY
jgi:hypothetical protein